MKFLPKEKAAFWSGGLWGLMEATWFFLVPDILLCYWAMRSVRVAVIATLAVVLGAELGAVILYSLLGDSVVCTIRGILLCIPMRTPTRRKSSQALGLLTAFYWVGLYAWYWGRLVPNLYGP